MNFFPVIIERRREYWRVMDLGMEPIADRVVAEVKPKWLAVILAYLTHRGIA